jgi:histidinol-phosphate phosphatase family protein
MNYLADPNKIHLYRGVIPALKQLKKNRWKLIIGTNQAGIAYGYLNLKILKKIHARLTKMFKQKGLRIDGILFCPHHPKDQCPCRKPQPGMLLEAKKRYHLNLKESIVIGDKESDIEWGQKAGLKTILVLTGYGQQTLKRREVQADRVARSIPEAVRWILRGEKKWNL